VRESVEIIKHEQATPAGVVIALDRQERGQGERSAIQEVEADYGLPVSAIVRLEQLIEYLQLKEDSATDLQRIQAYRQTYGV
ncbi:MAG: orotate phosphoribosyltransferase, partial [Candidatus Thiodiazotropha endolucinida]|nr:orotate phosphoribosyltransferase [Candidatus Thiodiazotropha taylori]MCW4241183.1 orotate phosphoribosyltransferase [Candidatus Thiodiazotropha taylori]